MPNSGNANTFRSAVFLSSKAVTGGMTAYAEQLSFKAVIV